MVGTNAIGPRDPQVRRAPNSSSSLYDILDLILDKGIVIDAFVRVSLVGIELLTVDARVVIASVDTYLRYAEGAERLQLYNRSGSERIPDFIEHRAKRNKVAQVAGKGIEAAERVIEGRHRGEEHEDQGHEQEEGVGGTLARGVRNVVGKIVHTVAGEDENEDEGASSQEPEPKQRPERREQRGNGRGAKPAKAGMRR